MCERARRPIARTPRPTRPRIGAGASGRARFQSIRPAAAPAGGDLRMHGQGRQADRGQEQGHRRARHPGPAPRVAVQLALGLGDQPGGAQQRIAGHEAERGQRRIGRQPVERPAREGPVPDRDPLDEAADDQALGDGRHQRATSEGRRPEPLAAAPPVQSELERHPAQDQGEQHDHHGDVERRHDHGVSGRKGGQQPAAAHHQPGLVAVPDRRDSVHHQVAVGRVAREGEQDPDAEVEAVQQHIEQHRDGQDTRHDQGQVEAHGAGSPGGHGRSGRRAAARPARPRRPVRALRDQAQDVEVRRR